MGVVCGTRELDPDDPQDRGVVRLGTGAEGGRLEGRGTEPKDALLETHDQPSQPQPPTGTIAP